MTKSRWTMIIPVAFVMYMLAFMDRINVGIVMPYIQEDLNLSASAAGDIAGVFFFGYLFLQIPGGILASKWSARKLIFILMIFWGIAAVATGLVQNETQLLVARFLLGIAEGGVWPAVLVLLASWFSVKERARANALWMACMPVSAMIMAPISGWLLVYFDWKAVLIIQGLPPLVWAFVWLWLVRDQPSQVKWLSDKDRAYLLNEEKKEKAKVVGKAKYSDVFKNKTVWALLFMSFLWVAGFYGYNMWVPSLVGQLTKDPVTMGWLTAIPFTAGLIGMILNSYLSDKRMNRIQHVVYPLLIGAISMICGQLVDSTLLKMVFLSITAFGLYAPYGPLWAIPTAILPASIVGLALGIQNVFSGLGGYVGPKMIGVLFDKTGNYNVGFYFLATLIILAALITATFIKRFTDQRAREIEALENKISS